MLQSTGQDPNKNASVMENHIFKKSKSKDEYLGMLAKLYLHLKDMPKSKRICTIPNKNGKSELLLK